MNTLGRENLGNWLNYHGLVGTGVEVGCAEGLFAISVLKQWRGKRYFMVDPWEVLPESEYLERQETMNYEDWYKSCKELARYDSRVALMRLRSVIAADMFSNDALDWVYLDAAHDFKNVSQDINAWYNKVKQGGLFGGHDFMTRMEGDSRIQVDRAVEDFAYQNKLTFTVTPCTSWWMIKP